MGKSKRRKKAMLDKIAQLQIGMPADEVLLIAGEKPRTHVIGSDENGLVVEWIFPHHKAVFELRRTVLEGGKNHYAISKRIR